MNRDRLVKTFIDLVRIDSPSGEEEKLGRFLIKYLLNNKLVGRAEIDKAGNVVAHLSGERDPFLVCAHQDTVEPGRGIVPRVSDELITSSGNTILGADNKAAMAAILELLHIIEDSRKDHRSLEIVFTVDEEGSSVGSLGLDFTSFKSKEGLIFDSALPVGTINTASPFYERIDISLRGKEAHASRPDLAINVLYPFSEMLQKLSLGKLDDESVFNIGRIEGGSVRNTIPGTVQLKAELRSFDEKKLQVHEKRIIDTFKQTAKSFNTQIEIDTKVENPGYKHTSASSKRLLDEVSRVVSKLSLPLDYQMSWGVSDANFFNHAGITVLNLGDGCEFAHSTREQIKISELENMTRILEQLVCVA